MPLVKSTYISPFLYFNRHLETVFPSLLRSVKGINYQRERINTPDNDFLDLDWVKNGNKKVVIICHGLEGSSDRPYMKGMAKIFAENNYDVLTWNYRGCSGEINRQARAYHSGATDDFQVVINRVFEQSYDQISIIGFSLGGNMVLKYLGEQNYNLDARIKKAVTISVPLHLHSSCIEISKWHNYPYELRFLRNLKNKLKLKAQLIPDQLSLNNFNTIKSIIDFDDQYTAPIHGFKDAIDYYESCSALNFLPDIHIPTLIINAKNDSFLSNKCYPTALVSKHEFVFLEIPKNGGHCGFPGTDKSGHLWSEKRTLDFIT